MREGEKKMEETPYLEGGRVGVENDSMSLRRLPRPAKKILLFLDREGTNCGRGEMERTSTGSIHSLLDANSVRARVSRAGERRDG